MLAFACILTLLLLAAMGALALAARRKHRRQALSAVGFLVPSAVHLGFFLLAPLAFSLYMAFHRWTLLGGERPWVGLMNFRSLLASETFWTALRSTARYSLHVPVSLAIGLAVAVLLDRCGRSRGLLQTIFFLPNLCLLAAVAMVWKWIYNSEYGILNRMLEALGAADRVGWLTSAHLVGGVLPLPLLSLMVMAVWAGMGVQAVIYLSALRAIPRTYYEAAAMDGAGRWQSFWHVTVPLLRPTTLFLLVTSVIASFQVFTSVYVMLGETLLRTRQADVLVYQIYDHAWGVGGDFGLASALSWLLFLIILAVTAVQFRVIGREAGAP